MKTPAEMNTFVSLARSRDVTGAELIRLVRSEFSLSLLEAKALLQTGTTDVSALSQRQARMMPAILQEVAEAEAASHSKDPLFRGDELQGTAGDVKND